MVYEYYASEGHGVHGAKSLLYGETVVSGPGDPPLEDTWEWSSGANDFPGVIAFFDWSSAGIDDSAIETVSISGVAGGRGFTQHRPADPAGACRAASGNGVCSDSTYLFCESVCCEGRYPYYCSATNLCYQSSADASAACSGGCTACGTDGSPWDGVTIDAWDAYSGEWLPFGQNFSSADAPGAFNAGTTAQGQRMITRDKRIHLRFRPYLPTNSGITPATTFIDYVELIVGYRD